MQVVDVDHELEQKALTHRDRAAALTITDQQTYDVATDTLRGLAQLEREITDHYKPMKDAAYQAHRRVCESEKSMLEPVSAAVRLLRTKVTAWTLEQDRIRVEAERRAREEAERIRREQEAEAERQRQIYEAEQRARDEELRLQAATQAEAEGASDAEVAAILEQPVMDAAPVFFAPPPPPAPIVAPTYTPAAGISKPRENWTFQITDFLALVRYVGEHPEDQNLLAVNETNLRALVRSRKQLTNLPGVRAFNDPTISVRRTR